jgi:hypothetical protein
MDAADRRHHGCRRHRAAWTAAHQTDEAHPDDCRFRRAAGLQSEHHLQRARRARCATAWNRVRHRDGRHQRSDDQTAELRDDRQHEGAPNERAGRQPDPGPGPTRTGGGRYRPVGRDVGNESGRGRLA